MNTNSDLAGSEKQLESTTMEQNYEKLKICTPNEDETDFIHITVISDTRRKHELLNKELLGGEILIHAGNFSEKGRPEEAKAFCEWFADLPGYTKKYLVPGNQDLLKNHPPKLIYDVIDQFKDRIICLKNQTRVLKIRGSTLNIHGTPWIPKFDQSHYKACHDKSVHIPKIYLPSSIPSKVDILISHSPPMGILDLAEKEKSLDTSEDEHVGSNWIADRVKAVKPKMHVFGHAPKSSGILQQEGTLYVNASVDDINKPKKFKLQISTGEITEC